MLEHHQSNGATCEDTVVLASGQRIFIKGQKWVSLLNLGEGFHVAAKAEGLCPTPLYLINENDDNE